MDKIYKKINLLNNSRNLKENIIIIFLKKMSIFFKEVNETNYTDLSINGPSITAGNLLELIKRSKMISEDTEIKLIDPDTNQCTIIFNLKVLI